MRLSPGGTRGIESEQTKNPSGLLIYTAVAERPRDSSLSYACWHVWCSLQSLITFLATHVKRFGVVGLTSTRQQGRRDRISSR